MLKESDFNILNRRIVNAWKLFSALQQKESKILYSQS